MTWQPPLVCMVGVSGSGILQTAAPSGAHRFARDVPKKNRQVTRCDRGPSARFRRVAAGEGDQAGLFVSVGGDVDPGAEVATLAENGVHRFHASEEAVHLVRVESLVEAGGPGEVPRVDQDVGCTEHLDGGFDGVAAGLRAELGGRDDRIVEGGLEGAVECEPGGDRVVVDGWDGRRVEPGGSEEQPGHPLDQVADDVAGQPAFTGSGIVPGVGRDRLDPPAEGAGHFAVTIRRRFHGAEPTDEAARTGPGEGSASRRRTVGAGDRVEAVGGATEVAGSSLWATPAEAMDLPAPPAPPVPTR